MNLKRRNRGPNVRIGVIQSIGQAQLKVNTPALLLNDQGEKLREIQAGEMIEFKIRHSKPARLKHVIRLAKLTELSAAETLLVRLRNEGCPVEVLQVGVNLAFKEQKVDNREFWILTGNYPDAAAARQAQNNFLQFEDQTPLAIPVEPPSGEIGLEETSFGPIVRIVPTELSDSRITIANVRVGIEFHWDHLEEQDYRGVIEIRFNNTGQLLVINEVALEDYLTSVNSSEMTPDCPPDLLKAQTVAARSTIFATMGKHHFDAPFHLCADDHCQCYRGTRCEQPASVQAVNKCLGEVLIHSDQVCDARYAKICGGVMESYEHVWDNRKIPYLRAGIDGEFKIELPIDTDEKARAYIDAAPNAYCNTDKYELPKMLEFSNRLFRWKVEYPREELEKIISEKTNEDLGELKDIRLLERGESGRLKYIELVGSKKTLKVGKELAIRRALSRSHLYSACFYVETKMLDGKVTHFIFVGAGWGHGVGLCQVGATIMAQKGMDYQTILKHYYKDSSLVKLY